MATVPSGGQVQWRDEPSTSRRRARPLTPPEPGTPATVTSMMPGSVLTTAPVTADVFPVTGPPGPPQIVHVDGLADIGFGDIVSLILQVCLLVICIFEIASDMRLLLLFTSEQFRNLADQRKAQGLDWPSSEVTFMYWHVAWLLAACVGQLLMITGRVSTLFRTRNTVILVAASGGAEGQQRAAAKALADARIHRDAARQKAGYPLDILMAVNMVVSEWPKVAVFLSLINRLYGMHAWCSTQDILFQDDFITSIFSQDPATATHQAFTHHFASDVLAPLPPSTLPPPPAPPPGTMVYEFSPPPLACITKDILDPIKGSLFLTCMNCIATLLKFWTKESSAIEDLIMTFGMGLVMTPLLLWRALTASVVFAQVQGLYTSQYDLTWNKYIRMALASLITGLSTSASILLLCGATKLHVKVLSLIRPAVQQQQTPVDAGHWQESQADREKQVLANELARLRHQVRMERERAARVLARARRGSYHSSDEELEADLELGTARGGSAATRAARLRALAAGTSKSGRDVLKGGTSDQNIAFNRRPGSLPNSLPNSRSQWADHVSRFDRDSERESPSARSPQARQPAPTSTDLTRPSPDHTPSQGHVSTPVRRRQRVQAWGDGGPSLESPPGATVQLSGGATNTSTPSSPSHSTVTGSRLLVGKSGLGTPPTSLGRSTGSTVGMQTLMQTPLAGTRIIQRDDVDNTPRVWGSGVSGSVSKSSPEGPHSTTGAPGSNRGSPKPRKHVGKEGREPLLDPDNDVPSAPVSSSSVNHPLQAPADWSLPRVRTRPDSTSGRPTSGNSNESDVFTFAPPPPNPPMPPPSAPPMPQGQSGPEAFAILPGQMDEEDYGPQSLHTTPPLGTPPPGIRVPTAPLHESNEEAKVLNTARNSSHGGSVHSGENVLLFSNVLSPWSRGPANHLAAGAAGKAQPEEHINPATSTPSIPDSSSTTTTTTTATPLNLPSVSQNKSDGSFVSPSNSFGRQSDISMTTISPPNGAPSGPLSPDTPAPSAPARGPTKRSPSFPGTLLSMPVGDTPASRMDAAATALQLAYRIGHMQQEAANAANGLMRAASRPQHPALPSNASASVSSVGTATVPSLGSVPELAAALSAAMPTLPEADAQAWMQVLDVINNTQTPSHSNITLSNVPGIPAATYISTDHHPVIFSGSINSDENTSLSQLVTFRGNWAGLASGAAIVETIDMAPAVDGLEGDAPSPTGVPQPSVAGYSAMATPPHSRVLNFNLSNHPSHHDEDEYYGGGTPAAYRAMYRSQRTYMDASSTGSTPMVGRREDSFTAHKQVVLDGLRAQDTINNIGRPNDLDPDSPREMGPRTMGLLSGQQGSSGPTKEPSFAAKKLRALYIKASAFPVVLVALASFVCAATNVGMLQEELDWGSSWLYSDIAAAVVQLLLTGALTALIIAGGVIDDGSNDDNAKTETQTVNLLPV